MKTYTPVEGLELRLQTSPDGYTYLPTHEHLRWAKQMGLKTNTDITLNGKYAIAVTNVLDSDGAVVAKAHQSMNLENDETAVGIAEQRAIGRALEFCGLTLPDEIKYAEKKQPVESVATQVAQKAQAIFPHATHTITTTATNGTMKVLKSKKYLGKSCKEVPTRDLQGYRDFLSRCEKKSGAMLEDIKTITEYLVK
jgi:hypothetical protein